MPVTTPGLTPFGSNHALVEGTEVFGMFRDDSMQDFVVMGVQQGITQTGFHEGIDNKLINRRVDYGFNDPRREDAKAYDDTSDGTNPPQSSSRGNSLAAGLDVSPHLPKAHIFAYTGRGLGKTEEYEDSEKLKTNDDGSITPYYPLNADVSDINQFSALDKQEEKGNSHDVAPLNRDLSLVFEDVKSVANPQYPYNHATYTESGHLFELDDTRDFERVSLQHRSGTYFEWQPDGDSHSRIVKDNYTVVCGNDEVFIGGKVNVKILGDAKLHVTGKADITSKKQITLTSPLIKAYGKSIGFNS